MENWSVNTGGKTLHDSISGSYFDSIISEVAGLLGHVRI